MREHPIPQDITGYKFHLVGSMTLKQFAEVLAGVVIAFVIFKSGLPGIIRWPFILLFAGTGVMAAFVPIEERPLDHWIISFFKVLFRPTKFFWKREPQIPDLFNYTPQDRDASYGSDVDLAPARKQKIYQYLQSIYQPSQELDAFDLDESNAVSQLLNDFQNTPTFVKPQKNQMEIKKPNLKVRVRRMKNFGKISSVGEDIQPSADITSTIPTQDLSSNLVETGFQKILKSNPNNIPQETPPKLKTGEETQISLPSPPLVDTPFPLTGSTFNQIGGVVISATGELIEDALIEIKNTSGQTLTATSSNSLGQFLISGQLKNGSYTLEVKNTNYSFEPAVIELTGKMTEPVEIRASA